ncbi:GNAT family N-acetyltransferase [Aspergillus keveii]|uniref:GNAT family N-acetyltransferase n=1 Tax=Aspergillus keveii TaxID=714993 RepID=A0ABR4G997_9EURO
MTTPYKIRTHLATDMETIVRRHGMLYSKEHNFDPHLAASVASQVTTAFLATYDATRERFWVAEAEQQDGTNTFIGCVFLAKDKTETEFPCAKLRLLLVEPAARGMGLGRELIARCTEFAREAGYARIRLWTNSGLGTARRLYEREGYKLLRSEEDDTFGIKLTAEFWEMVL